MEEQENTTDQTRLSSQKQRDLATAGGGSIPASGQPAASSANNTSVGSNQEDKRDEGASSEVQGRKSSKRDEGPNAARRDYQDMSFDPTQATTPDKVKHPTKKQAD